MKRKNSEANKENADISTLPASKRTNKKSSIPPINWAGNKMELTWKLLTLIEKPDNRKIVIARLKKQKIQGLTENACIPPDR
ncbi:hypothetical protein HGRIS_011969 [Hohenbuehelia grisea]|uniref:Uncharacterized protein n=1 Tax=Hohenbuehelia grisea TaxID=104357 RepID=A0ABR3JY51_9AGAR